jgi:hypothetical protein
MRRLLFFIAPLSLLLTAAEPPLPVVEEVEWGPLRDQCRQVLEALEAAKSPLPAETARPLRALLEKGAGPKAAARAQELLDNHCLLAVSINPESRVKVARGPAAADLVLGREAVVLIKVHNDAGITPALRVAGPELIRPGRTGGGRWLQAAVVTDAPFGPKLSGRRLEYRLLRLTAREAGRREATFRLDVGQGTQDLGFRAEVPVLFRVGDASQKRR